MSLKLLDEAIEGIGRLAIDTAPIIYFIEENPRYLSLVGSIFERVARGSLPAVTSAITLCEVLTRPLQQGRDDLREGYTELLLNAEHFSTLPLDVEAATLAARLRARHGIRTPDAFQIACALASECDAFLTNDGTLKRVDEIRVLVLDDLLAAGA